ncbi:MAG: hypothetical protein ACT4PE_08885 [Candidatus Eiseniibacteriota bacterium]
MSARRAASRACCVLAAVGCVAGPASASPDGLDELARAVARFRGVGHADVESYRVVLELPDDPEGEPTPLVEIWLAPADLGLSAAQPGTSRAIVRGLALYLEPLYVARASLLGADLEGSVERLRATCEVRASSEGAGRRVIVEFPAEPVEGLPGELADLARIDVLLDRGGRISSMALATREGDRIDLECTYDGPASLSQPTRARWTLPGDDLVEIRTEFRSRSGRMLPRERVISFPSRYAPGETEEIRVRYRDWELGVELGASSFAAPDVFRYDGDGLVDD